MLTGQSENKFHNDYNRGDEQDYIREKHSGGFQLLPKPVNQQRAMGYLPHRNEHIPRAF
jgi:hypothetical protein